MKKTNVLVILDGFGISKKIHGNAIAAARKPNIDRLMKQYPHSVLQSHGMAVGLPKGQMGNSEVGHLNIGAGRVVYQDITRIDKSIEDGDFYTNAVLLDAIANVKKNNSAMHLVGLCSDGGVHSHLDHLYALLRLCKRESVKNVNVHCITDGRDTAPASAKTYVLQIEKECKQIGIGKIATVIGRYFYMDRDKRWDRTERGYACVFDGIGKHFTSATEAISASYREGIYDEFIEPAVINGFEGINEGDSVICFNFRSDRLRQISRAIIEPDFSEFTRPKGYKKVFYVGMTQYDETFKGINTAYPPKDIKNTLGEVLANNNLTQTRIAETEKYAHVTFFLNGGVERPYKGEQRILIPSPKVATYDLKPEMSATEVTSAALEQIGTVDVIIMNYANCDMVGHTGVFDAAVRAVETVDTCVGAITEKVLSVGGTMILTADHGNAEQMMGADGTPYTAHTINDVPIILIAERFSKNSKLRSGKLADVAPTMLAIIGIKKPAEMDGTTLLK